MKKFYCQYKHAIPLLVYGLLYLVWFSKLEKSVTRGYQVIHVSLDDHIPFCEWFVIPYFTWFLYIAIVVIYFFFKDKEDYRKICIFLFTGMTIFLLISTFFPNGHHLRPRVMPRNNFLTQWVAWLYQTDTPTNLWPSIHVYNSLGAHFAIVKSKRFEKKNWIKRSSLILCILIILSTMFIKQHSVWDVVTALLLGSVMYALVYSTDSIVDWHNRRKREHRPQAG